MDANFFLPEVLQFYLDDSQCNGIIEVSGDVSHFNRIDNPIIELFRTVEQDVREKNGHKLSFVAGCPTYNPAKNITSCHLPQHGWSSLETGKDKSKSTRDPCGSDCTDV